jgi:hypothetical protein
MILEDQERVVVHVPENLETSATNYGVNVGFGTRTSRCVLVSGGSCCKTFISIGGQSAGLVKKHQVMGPRVAFPVDGIVESRCE